MDKYDELPATPLMDRLLAARSLERAAFHMPGHGHGRGFIDRLGNLASLDTTEKDITDDLHHPGEALNEARALWAEAAGSARTWMLAAGSSLCIKAAILAAVSQGGDLVLEPWSHVSAFYATEIGRLRPEFVEGAARPAATFDPLPVTDPSALSDVLSSLQERAEAVFVTSPDYYGGLAPITELAEVCHHYDILLIVDEAHGTHLTFMDESPPSALAQGADIVIQSAHKTLPALTPAALLHVSAEGLRRLGFPRLQELEAWLKRLDSTSPSLLIAATADYARAWMEANGRAAAAAIRTGWQAIAADPVIKATGLRFSPVGANDEVNLVRDDLRCVIDCGAAGIRASYLVDSLADRGIYVEMNDWRRLVLIPSFPTGAEDLRLLRQELPEAWKAAWQKAARSAPVRLGPAAVDELTLAAYRAPRDLARDYGHVPDRQRYWLTVEESLGAVSDRLILPYPPGLPLLWPGERVTEAKHAWLKAYGEQSGHGWPQGVEVGDGEAGFLFRK